MVFITAYPFVWMGLSSFKLNREIYQPVKLLPEVFDLWVYHLLLSGEFIDFYGVLVRSIMLAAAGFLACLITAGAGFAIAKGSFVEKHC